jgi:sugar lactone lactonase YvrE
MDSPTAVAYSDNGTPLDPTDDYLYVADAVKGSILKYHIGSTGAELVASTDGFDSPTAIATGRWNGANNGFVYVVDNVGKRVRVLEDTGNSLATVAEYREGYDSYFNSVTVDHFGNAYLADLTLSRLVKLSASLDLLDEEQEDGRYASLAVVDIPFGRITVDGQGTTWAGFDQLFAVERWSDMSGVQRRTLGLRLKDVTFSADQDVSMISGRFVLTDFGLVKARVFDANGTLVRSVFSSAMVSGPKEIAWDRRDDSGRLVPPGEYRYELSGTTPYRQETVTATSRWTLPLYYDERGGADDPHLVRGTPLRWGTSSAAQDNDAVQFRFTGLNPAGSYSVRAEYLAPDSIARLQDLTTGNGIRLHEPVRVGPTSTVVGYVPIPSEAFSSGELLVSINRRGEGNAVVSRLVLKETGTSFTSSPDVAPVPTAYALDQNYPNPFNPATVIRYEIPAGGPVSLAVYDINGREIIQLVNEVKPAGVYEVRFDASRVRPGGLASGVYFYRVTAGQYSNTKKMVLIR